MSLYQGKRFNIGQMRHRIRVEELTQTLDSTTGQPTRTWSAFVHAEPAAFVDNRGGEGIRGGQVEAQGSVVFTVRYRPGYAPTMRVYFDGIYYHITSVVQVGGYKRYVELYARTVDNGGIN